jgi:hypothetical protein
MNSAPSPEPNFQFSLGTLLLLVTGCAVVLAIAVQLGFDMLRTRPNRRQIRQLRPATPLFSSS